MKEVKSVYLPGLVSTACKAAGHRMAAIHIIRLNLERIDEFEGSHQSELYSVRHRPTGNEKFNFRFYPQKPYRGHAQPKRYHCNMPPGGGDDHSPNYSPHGQGDNKHSNSPTSPGQIHQQRGRRISWSHDRDRMFSQGF